MITPDEIAAIPLFAVMPEALRARIASRSGDIRVNTGEWIAHEGDAPYFWALLEGEVEILHRYGGETHQITTFEPGARLALTQGWVVRPCSIAFLAAGGRESYFAWFITQTNVVT